MRAHLLTLLSVLVLSGRLAGQHPDIWQSLAKEPDWRLSDPAYLYLVIQDGDTSREFLTFLHPARLRANWCEEAFMPDQQRQAHAFAYHLVRQTPRGYEVSFQPVDPTEPWTGRPVAGKELKVFFPRAERKLVKVTEKLSIRGFYGSPDLKR
jgi:hypothetical protein